jgi:hypothetical protein
MPKTYTINKISFKLKSDITLDEAEEVQELFKNLFIQEEQLDGLVTGSFSNSEIKRFLSIALEATPTSDKTEAKLYEGFDFGKVKESTAVEVIKDFFLCRIKNYQDFTSSYVKSIKQQ